MPCSGSLGNGLNGLRTKSAQPRGEETAPDDFSTRMGIGAIELAPWGSHVCVFYETVADLIGANVGYFAPALARGEAGVWEVSPPLTPAMAMEALRAAIPGIEAHANSGRFEIIAGHDHRLDNRHPDPGIIVDTWNKRASAALAQGCHGIRISGTAPCQPSSGWDAFCEYERTLSNILAGRQVTALCAYAMDASCLQDVFDVAHMHPCTFVRWHGRWEVLYEPEHPHNGLPTAAPPASCPLVGPVPAGWHLTPREYLVVLQVAQGASSKQAARAIGISPRTIEFHRSNAMRKLGARNTAELVRMTIGGAKDSIPAELRGQ